MPRQRVLNCLDLPDFAARRQQGRHCLVDESLRDRNRCHDFAAPQIREPVALLSLEEVEQYGIHARRVTLRVDSGAHVAPSPPLARTI